MSMLPEKRLNEQHKAFIIKYLALRKDYLTIKKDFQVFFEQEVSGPQILEVEANYQNKITALAEEELNNIWAEPLAHSRIRLALAYEALQDARKQRVITPSQRISESEWLPPEMGMNLNAIATFLKIGQNEEYMAKRLLLEVKKLGLEEERDEIITSGFHNVTINTGIEAKDAEETK